MLALTAKSSVPAAHSRLQEQCFGLLRRGNKKRGTQFRALISGRSRIMLCESCTGGDRGQRSGHIYSPALTRGCFKSINCLPDRRLSSRLLLSTYVHSICNPLPNQGEIPRYNLWTIDMRTLNLRLLSRATIPEGIHRRHWSQGQCMGTSPLK